MAIVLMSAILVLVMFVGMMVAIGRAVNNGEELRKERLVFRETTGLVEDLQERLDSAMQEIKRLVGELGKADQRRRADREAVALACDARDEARIQTEKAIYWGYEVYEGLQRVLEDDMRKYREFFGKTPGWFENEKSNGRFQTEKFDDAHEASRPEGVGTPYPEVFRG